MADGQFVLVRSFPGPVGSPIISVGGLSTPQLPDHYPYPNPTNNIEVQQAMKVGRISILVYHYIIMKDQQLGPLQVPPGSVSLCLCRAQCVLHLQCVV